jgi:hypothetical protein
MSEPPIHPRIVEQTSKNFALARQFLAEMLDDPAQFDAVPEASRVILIPSDDDELAGMNVALAVQEMFRGNAVTLQRVGGPSPEAEAWRAVDQRHLLMHDVRFPTAELLASEVKIVYDQTRDTLLVDYFNGKRADFLWLEISPHIILRIDRVSHEIVGYLIASYLQSEAYRSPVIARALRKASFRSITDEELGDIAIVQHEETPFDDDEAAAVASEFIRWITPRSSRSADRKRDSA